MFLNIVFAIPFLMGAFQLILLFTFFKYDTPPQLKKKNDHITLRKLFSKIYVPDAVNTRMDSVQGELSSVPVSENGEEIK